MNKEQEAQLRNNINRWENEPAQLETELPIFIKDLLKSNKQELIEDIESKLPKDREPCFKNGEVITTPTHKVASCVNTGRNETIKEIKDLLNKYK